MTSRTAHRRARGRDLVDPNPAWSRDRLRLLAGGVVAAAVVVLVGLGLAIGQALDPTRATASAPDPTPAVVKSTTAGTAAVPGAGRDAAAAAPMPAVPGGRAAELPPAVAPDALRLPQPTCCGALVGWRRASRARWRGRWPSWPPSTSWC